MGKECIVSSLEEMCDLMCDNNLPKEKEQWWIFTFGMSKEVYGDNAEKYVKIYGTYSTARSKMFDEYGSKWAFQYSEEEWTEMTLDPNRYWDMETHLKTIY